MQSSHHNLFLLLILFILFSFFPTSFSQTNCKCEEIPDGNNGANPTDQSSNQNPQVPINQKGQDASQSSSGGSSTNTNQGSSQSSSQSGSQSGNSQGTAPSNSQGSTSPNSSPGQGAMQGNAQGSIDTDIDIDINLKGYFSKVFAFGDSFTGGSDSNFQSSAQKMGYNHHLMIDFVCNALGLPQLPSYKNSSQTDYQHGVNFAIPGASALPKDELDRFSRVGKVAAGFLRATTESFLTQITWFNDFLKQIGCQQKDNCKEELDTALFWLGGMGVDDHVRTAGTSYSLQWLKEKSVAHVSAMLHDLLKNGAKHVVVQGLPPLGCLLFEVSLCPIKHLNTLGCAVAANAATMIHNRILQRTIETFQEQYPQAKIVYGDLWGAFMSILQNPGKFQFQETFKACCGTGGNNNFNINSLCGAPGTSKCTDPSKYMFWDGIQLTANMNRQLTHLVLKQVGSHLIK